MALTKIARHRAPNDGSWFCTTANLNSVLRAATNYDDERALWPSWADDTRVPVWVRMVKYKAQETRERPDGMIYGPIVRVGTMDSRDVEMFGYHHAAGLFSDYHLYYDQIDNWIYDPYGYGDATPPGEDVSVYRCSQCGHNLYRDDEGRRHDRSACIYKGALVCRDCDVRGLVYAQDVADRIEACRSLAISVSGDCFTAFNNRLDFFSDDREATENRHGQQVRLHLDGKWSFGFSTVVFTGEGKKRGMNGGLIQHGPHPSRNEDGSWRFTTWDYKAEKEREATREEISNIRWSIHT